MRTKNRVVRLAVAASVLWGGVLASQMKPGDKAAVQHFVVRWNAAYTGLDAKALAALETSDFELIDRFGHRIQSQGRAFNERLWTLTFKDIYRGKPGPEHTIEHIRFLSPTVALVQAHADWGEVTLDDATRIPPHGEIATFVLVRDGNEWRAASLNIHNQLAPGAEGPGQKPPLPAATGPSPN